MYSHTHFGVGLVASQVFFPGDNLSQIIVIGGSLIPDVPSFPMYILDKMKGKEPFKEQAKTFTTISEVLHSLIVWFVSGFCWPLFVGIYSHLLLDWWSHSAERFRETDSSMIWPIWPFLGDIKLRGFFEYRRDYGMELNLYESLFFVLCVLVASWLKFF